MTNDSTEPTSGEVQAQSPSRGTITIQKRHLRVAAVIAALLVAFPYLAHAGHKLESGGDSKDTSGFSCPYLKAAADSGDSGALRDYQQFC